MHKKLATCMVVNKPQVELDCIHAFSLKITSSLIRIGAFHQSQLEIFLPYKLVKMIV